MRTAKTRPGKAGRSSALPDGLEKPARYWAAAALMLGIGVTTLDSAVVNVALPTIARDLDISPAAVVWVVMAYSLVLLVSLLPLSAVAERIGFRRMYALGITLFLVATTASMLSTSLASLAIARVAQGLGGAMLMCLFGGLVRQIYPLRRLGFGISLNAMLVGVMLVLGPTIGAFLLQVASWRWIFAVNIPLCLAAYVGVRFLPEGPRNESRFDWLACGLSMLLFGTLVIGLDALVKDPVRSAVCFVIAGFAGTLLYRRSKEQASPLVPIDLLRIRPVAFAVGASGFTFAAQTASFVGLPFYFQKVMGATYIDIGLLLGAWSIGVAVMAPLAGVMSDRFPVAVLSGLGALSMAAGLGWVILLPVSVHFAWLMAAMLLGGIGFGFFQTPNNRALLGGAPRHRSGAAGGLQATTRVFGQSCGTALVAIAFSASDAHGAMLAVAAGMVCALIALGINVMRHLDPAPDLEP